MSVRVSLLSAATLAAVMACSTTSGPDPADQIFDASFQLWASSGPASYDLVLRRECICTQPQTDVTIQVRNKVVVSRTYTDTGDPVEAQKAPLFPDVPGLFTLVRNAMDSDPYYFSAEYDGTYGHPVVIQLNVTPGRNDDDVTYRTTSLTPVN